MMLELPPDLQTFVDDRVAAGAYSTPEAVVRAALQLLERREQLLAHIDEGCDQIKRGEATTIEDDDDLDAFIEQVKSRGRESMQSDRGAT